MEMPLSRKKRPFPPGDLKPGPVQKKKKVQGLRQRTETLTQTKANTWNHIYTNAQQIAKLDELRSR